VTARSRTLLRAGSMGTALALALALTGSGQVLADDSGNDDAEVVASGAEGGSDAGGSGAENDPGQGGGAGEDPGQGGGAGEDPGQGGGAGEDPGQGGGAGEDPGQGEDPPGNNGTIKIKVDGEDVTNANVPQPGCQFAVRFFGFDDGQLGVVTVSLQGQDRSEVFSTSVLLVSGDPAGGGQDVDELVGPLTAGDLGLLESDSNHPHGFLLRVDLEVFNADGSPVPGSGKSKNLILSVCAPDEDEGVRDDDDTRVEDEELVRDDDDTRAEDDETAVLDLVLTPQPLQPAPTAVLPAQFAVPVPEAAETQVRGSAVPFRLPFTGPADLLVLVLAGATALGLGALALLAGRRRHQPRHALTR